jgi:hypothetical protein
MLRKTLPLLTGHSREAESRRLFCSVRTFFSTKLMLSPHPTFFSWLQPRGLAFNERYRSFQYQTRDRIYDLILKVCKSVHHRKVQINHQPDATIYQFIILTFIYSSTCFGRFLAHHQELNDCSSSLWFYIRIVVTTVLCSWSGRQSTTITTI